MRSSRYSVGSLLGWLSGVACLVGAAYFVVVAAQFAFASDADQALVGAYGALGLALALAVVPCLLLRERSRRRAPRRSRGSSS